LVPRAQAARLDVVRIPSARRETRVEPDTAAVAERAIRAIRSALPAGGASARISLPDESGRLRLAVAVGDLGGAIPARSERNRTAYRDMRPVRTSLLRPRGFGVAVLPFVAGGSSLGVLEVVAPSRALDDAWPLIEAITVMAAASLYHVRELVRLDRREQSFRALAPLVTELVRAETADDALRTVVHRWYERLGTPAAAWDVAGAEPYVVAVRGVGSSKRAELGRRLTARMRAEPRSQPAALARTVFSEVSGIDEVAAVDASRAVVAVASHPVGAESIEFLGSFLTDVLDHVDAVAWAKRRERELERSLVVTAHELREPLVAVRAQLDGMLYRGGRRGDRAERESLHRARGDLEALAETADAVLRWAATGETPRMRRTDLVAVAREVAASANAEADAARVTLTGPPRAMIRAARVHLKVAVANVVRNALAYAPPSSEVSCRVEQHRGVASLTVRDRGPGVPAAEARAIFDPFTRGGTGHLSRSGRGLGLYIARRIVEAQGGAIHLEDGDDESGAAFRIDMPLAGRMSTDDERSVIASPRR
jgi:signal transduction histidine kinase